MVPTTMVQGKMATSFFSTSLQIMGGRHVTSTSWTRTGQRRKLDASSSFSFCSGVIPLATTFRFPASTTGTFERCAWWGSFSRCRVLWRLEHGVEDGVPPRQEHASLSQITLGSIPPRMVPFFSSASTTWFALRETPRGGIFAKIPGLNYHIFSKLKRETERTKFRPPHLTSGNVRKYDADEAEIAAFR